MLWRSFSKKQDLLSEGVPIIVQWWVHDYYLLVSIRKNNFLRANFQKDGAHGGHQMVGRIDIQAWNTLGQNHKKHSIALLVPFVSKKGTNRGIKCQFDILEKNPKGGPFYVKKIFISISAQISCVSSQGQNHSTFSIGPLF